MKNILSTEVKSIKSAEELLIAMVSKTLVIHSNVEFGKQSTDLRKGNTTLDYLHQFKIVNDSVFYLPIAVNYGISGYHLNILMKYFFNDSYSEKVNINDLFDYFVELKKKGYFIEFRESDIFDDTIQNTMFELYSRYKELFNITKGAKKHDKSKKVTGNVIGVDNFGSSWSPTTLYTIGDGYNFTGIYFEKNDYRPIEIKDAKYNQRPETTYSVSKKVLQQFVIDCEEWKNSFEKLQNDLVKVMRSVYNKK